MKTKKQTKLFRGFKIEFESDMDGVFLYDTGVTIEPTRITDKIMFVIAGNDIDNFTNEFAELIEKYRI